MRLVVITGAAIALAFAATSAEAATKAKSEPAARVVFKPIKVKRGETVTSAVVEDTAVAGTLVVSPPARSVFVPPAISPLPAPALDSRGTLQGGVGVTVASVPSANRTPAASFF